MPFASKLKTFEKPQKIILGCGVPIIVFLLIIGATNPITDELNIGSSWGIDPYDLDDSWWIWTLGIVFIMIFEWILFTPGREESVVIETEQDMDDIREALKISIKKSAKIAREAKEVGDEERVTYEKARIRAMVAKAETLLESKK